MGFHFQRDWRSHRRPWRLWITCWDWDFKANSFSIQTIISSFETHKSCSCSLKLYYLPKQVDDDSHCKNVIGVWVDSRSSSEYYELWISWRFFGRAPSGWKYGGVKWVHSESVRAPWLASYAYFITQKSKNCINLVKKPNNMADCKHSFVLWSSLV